MSSKQGRKDFLSQKRTEKEPYNNYNEPDAQDSQRYENPSSGDNIKNDSQRYYDQKPATSQGQRSNQSIYATGGTSRPFSAKQLHIYIFNY